MAKATWEGAVLAQSAQTVEVEGNQYFPPDAIHKEYFRPSEQHTVCPWKGTASYYDVEVNGKRNAAFSNLAGIVPGTGTAGSSSLCSSE